LFGIYFYKNYHLRRILTDYGFTHHPLKKNFPLTGYYELNYSFMNKLIELKKVILVQELRNLLSENNWNFSLQLY
jgi:NADH-quinone oxidoreductase subunit C